jgi:hypothetical protein
LVARLPSQDQPRPAFTVNDTRLEVGIDSGFDPADFTGPVRLSPQQPLMRRHWSTPLRSAVATTPESPR